MGCLRKAVTDDNVYEGICIGCHPNQVPPYVVEDWKHRNPQSSNEQVEEILVDDDEEEEEPEPESVPEQPQEVPAEKYEPEPEPEYEEEIVEEIVEVEEEKEPETVEEGEPDPEVSMNDWRSNWANRPKGTYQW